MGRLKRKDRGLFKGRLYKLCPCLKRQEDSSPRRFLLGLIIILTVQFLLHIFLIFPYLTGTRHLTQTIVFAGTSLSTLLVHLSFYTLNISLFLLLPTLTFSNPGFLPPPPPQVFNVLPVLLNRLSYRSL
jgi:hypothetical protein